MKRRLTDCRAVIRCPACTEWHCMDITGRPQEYFCTLCGSVWVKPPVPRAKAVGGELGRV